jgi:signal transduction histidine kinase
MSERVILRLMTAAAMALVAPGCPMSAASQPADPSRTVLTIHWGPEDFPGTASVDAAIREALLSSVEPAIHYYAEYLETEEFPSNAALLAFRDYVREKFAGRGVDVVIANSTPALQFALRYREELFPGVPVVFVGGSLRGLTVDSAYAGVTGVLSDAPFAETLELALKLHPSVRRVYVVAQAPTSEGYDERVRTALQPFSQRVELTYIKERTVAGLLAAVKAISEHSLVLYTRYTPEEADGVVHPDDVARLLVRVSPVPIYTSADLFFGTGVVGGMIKGSRAAGSRLGEIARQILDGARPDDIPVGTVPATPTFDWRQVQRWGIDPALIPVGADIQFRMPTVWESYRGYIVAAVTLLLMQTALITALLVQRRHRRRAEGELRQSEAALRKSYERNRDLGARLLQAKEAEHARIARELHDDICQRMLLLTIELESWGRARPEEASAARALKVAREIAVSLHDLSHRLHPTRLRLIGLVAALDRLCIEVSRTGIAVAFAHREVPAPLPPDLVLCLFRIVQEALQNAIKYSSARQISVRLSGGTDGLVLTIGDDGVGFDVNTAWDKGVGLVSMVERLEAIGGTLDIRSTAGEGTRLTAAVPLNVMPNPQSDVPVAVQRTRTRTKWWVSGPRRSEIKQEHRPT